MLRARPCCRPDSDTPEFPCRAVAPSEKLLNLSGPLSVPFCEMGASPAPAYCRGCLRRQRRLGEASAGAPGLSHPSHRARLPQNHTNKRLEDRNGLN